MTLPGGAVLNIVTGYTETAPANGYLLGSTTLNASLNVSQTLTIQKSGTGMNPVILAPLNGISTTTDGIFKIAGADYIKIDGIDLKENPGNTTATTQMEWGYALVKFRNTAPFDGCQYITIQNCVINLNKTNTASVAIYGNAHIATNTTALTITAASDANSYCKFYNNTINNTYTGIQMQGSSVVGLQDQNNEIGASGKGNNITGMGGGSATAYGIASTYQNNFNVVSNTISGGTGTTASNVYGIYVATAPGSVNTIRNNTIQDTSSTTSGALYGIYSSAGAGANGRVDIDGNTVQRCAVIAAGTTAAFYAIFTSSAPDSLVVSGNIVKDNRMTGTGLFGCIYLSSGSETMGCRVTGNILNNNIKAATGGSFYLINMALSKAINCSGNKLYNDTNYAPTTFTAGIYSSLSFAGEERYFNNEISGLVSGGATFYGINISSGTSGNKFIYGNKITGLSSANAGAVTYGIYAPGGGVLNVYNNTIDNFENTGTSAIAGGLYLASSSTQGAYVYNNAISNLRAPNSLVAAAVRAIYCPASSAVKLLLYHNSVYLNNASASTASATSSTVFYLTNFASQSIELRNNIFINKSTFAGSGKNVIFQRSAAAAGEILTAASGNNCYYAGTPSQQNAIYYDGVTTDTTIAQFKAHAGGISETNSFSENTTFLNTTAVPYDLHILSNPTYCESGGALLGLVTTDIEGNIRAGNPGYTGTGLMPDVGAYESNYSGYPMVIDSINTVQNTLPLKKGALSMQILAVKMYVSSVANPLHVTKIKFTTAGTTNAADLVNAKVYYTGASSGFSTASQFGTTNNAVSGAFYASGNQTLQPGINYFWLTYDISATAALNNIIDATIDSIYTSGNNYIPLDGGNPAGARSVKAATSLNTSYTVGVGQTYATLTQAIDDLNGIGVSAPVTFILTDATYNITSGEVFPIVIQNYSGASVTNTVTIQPNTGVVATVGDKLNDAIIRLNGAQYVNIDGRQYNDGTPKSIIIQNDSAGNNASAITFTNDASNNKIQYAVLKGASSAASSGVVNFLTGLINGNDYNTIDTCDIGNAATTPSCLILSTGSTNTVANYNDNNIISRCSLFDFWNNTAESDAFKITGGNNNWTITKNHIYQTVSRTSSTGYYIFNIDNGGNMISHNNMSFTYNYLGGSAPYCQGSIPWTQASSGGYLNTKFAMGNLSASNFSNNAAANFQITSTSSNSISNSTNPPFVFSIVYLTGGAMHINNNLIGSDTLANSISVSAAVGGLVVPILVGGSNASGVISISQNRLGAIKTKSVTNVSNNLGGIYIRDNNNYNIDNNIIGNSFPNNFADSTSSTTTAQQLWGIRNDFGGGVLNIRGNIVRNMCNMGVGTAASAYALGISSSGGINNISGNEVYNIYNAGGVQGSTFDLASITGINITAATSGNIVSNNKIYGLCQKNTGAVSLNVNGININQVSASLISGNSIHSFSLAATGSASPAMNGINLQASIGGGARVVNNIVRLGVDTAGNPISSSALITGIKKWNNSAGSYTIANNTVYVGGTNVATGTPVLATHAFQRVSTTNNTGLVDSVFNNIFVNERSNALPGGGIHCPVNIGTNAGLVMNYNLYKTNAAVFGIYNSVNISSFTAWKAAVSADANSFVDNPNFINATGNSATMNLKLNFLTAAEGTGLFIPGIETDFEGDMRAGVTPTDIGADAGNYGDGAAPVITYTNLPNIGSLSYTNQRILSANITDNTGIYLTGSTIPYVYYKSGINGVYTSGTPGTFISGTPKNSNWNFSIDPSALVFGPADTLYYYVVAQDSTANNVGSNPSGVVAISTNNITSHPASASSYRVVNAISANQIINVGTGQTYTSLTANSAQGLFNYLNNSTLSGDVYVTITSDLTEDGSVVLNPVLEEGAGNYTIHIVPDGMMVRVISGSVTNGMIRLSGARRVDIDGSFAGNGRYLRFLNTNTANPTFTFINDASFNTIRNCIIEGLNTTVGSGVILFNTAMAGGNNRNCIAGNIIRNQTGSTSNVLNFITSIAVGVTAGNENKSDTIRDNEFFNFSSNAINLTNSSGNNWTISNNQIYQIAGRSSSVIAISVGGGSGHTISGNSIGGDAADRTGAMFTTSASSGGLVGIQISTTGNLPNYITGNSVANFGQLAGNPGVSVFPFYVSGGNSPLIMSDNIIDTISVSGNAGYGICILSGSNTITLQNNRISNMTMYSAANPLAGIMMGAAGSTITIKGNSIKNLSSAGTGTTPGTGLTGIFVQGGLNGNTIESNTITNIRHTNNGIGAYNAHGIYIMATTGNTISGNRVRNIGTTGSAFTTAVGIRLGTGDNTVLNNQIAMGQMTSDSTALFGILDDGNSDNKVYYNTVYINGTTNVSTGALSSYAYMRTAGGFPLMNNLFYNKRITTGTTGYNYSIGSTVDILPLTLGYNLLVSNDTARMVDLPSSVQGVVAFGNVYKAAGVSNTNWMQNASSVNDLNLFVDVNNGDLGINPLNQESWYANGKGIAISGISSDMNTVSGVRATSIVNGTTDIGSVEFNTSTIPPSAIQTGVLASNNTTDYWFANRKIASVNWGAAGSLPSVLDVKFYSGVSAPNLLSAKARFLSYVSMNATGGSGYTFNGSILYDSAYLGNVPGSANARVARYSNSSWDYFPGSTVNATSGMINMTVLNAFGNFTGTDNNNPLPVALMSFTGKVNDANVLLNWSTASELNNKGFEVERSADGKTFETIGFVKGNGTKQTVSNYAYTDINVFTHVQNASFIYRLRQLDFDGSSTLSEKVLVSKNKPQVSSLLVYPNPFNNELSIQIMSLSAAAATIQIADITGKEILTSIKQLIAGINVITLDEASSLHAGIYVVSVETGGEKQLIKLIKQ